MARRKVMLDHGWKWVDDADPIIEPTATGASMSPVIPGGLPTSHGILGDIFRIGGDIVTGIIPGTLDDRVWEHVKDATRKRPPVQPPGGSAGGILVNGFPEGPIGGRGSRRRTFAENCGPGYVDYGSGCEPIIGTDHTPISTTPAERSMGKGGFPAPILVQTNRLSCLPAPDGGSQVLYYSPQTGDQVCLPRSGGAAIAKAWGLLRKWKPRAKPKLSAYDAKMMKKYGPGGTKQKAIKKLAGEAGFKCVTKGSRR